MFRCKYCHNPDTIPLEIERKKIGEKEVMELVHKQKEYFWAKGGITFSGGEPLLQAHKLLPIIKRLKSEGFHVCIDTNGFVLNDAVKEILQLVDLVLPDLKQINPLKHRELVGQDNRNIFATLAYLDEIKKAYWLRYVLVPGHTDDENDLHELGRYIQTLTSIARLEILPYHNLGRSKWEKLWWEYPLDGVPAASIHDLDRAKAILSQYSDHILVRG